MKDLVTTKKSNNEIENLGPHGQSANIVLAQNKQSMIQQVLGQLTNTNQKRGTTPQKIGRSSGSMATTS